MNKLKIISILLVIFLSAGCTEQTTKDKNNKEQTDVSNQTKTPKELAIGRQIKLPMKGITLPNIIAKELYREIIENGDVEEDQINEFKNDPAKIFIANEVDLNNDGVPEILVTQSGVNHWCISHNCPIWIYTKEGTNYKRILSGIFIAYEILEEKENGYHKFVTIEHSSAAESYYQIFAFDKTSYKKQKCVKETYSIDDKGIEKVKYGDCD